MSSAHKNLVTIAAKAAATTTVAAVLLLTGGVAVAAPNNDTFQGRTPIGALPFSDMVDTTTATTDGDDAELNSACGAPATDASVWYEYTAAADGAIVIDVAASSYSTGVLVGTGGPGNWTIVTCGPYGVILPTTAGQTYAILAIDDQYDGGGNGGTLKIDVFEAPPPPAVDVTVDPFGSVNPHTGTATVRGTVTCTGEPDITLIQTELRQQVGRFTIIGRGLTGFVCDGATHPWSVNVRSENGKFSGGKAADATLAVACGQILCGFDYEERRVMLRH